jgi:ankyrin repeat protein
MAIYMRDLDAIRQHIKAGSDLNIQEPTLKSTPLITAAALGEPEAAQVLIDAGANINAKNKDGSTALITTAAFGKTKVAEVLIKSGADLNITNNDGSTALHTAAFLCNKEIVEALLNAGADKTIKNKRGNTAYESVSAPFENEKKIYDAINKSFKALGTELDYERIKTTRPIIAEMLK